MASRNTRRESTVTISHNEQISILSALRTRHIHPFAPELWDIFRKYQLILALSNVAHCKYQHARAALEELTKTVTNIIKEICKGTTASVKVQSNGASWYHPVTLSSYITDRDIIYAKSIQDDLYMQVDDSLESRKDSLLESFSFCVNQVEVILGKITRSSLQMLLVSDCFPEMATWHLGASTTEPAQVLPFFDFNDDSGGASSSEVVLDIYPRKEVAMWDLGKYGWLKGIVQLSLKFQTSAGLQCLTATGWLLSDDIVVTSGHCIYDERYGYLVEAQVTGRGGILPYSTPEVRQGVSAAVHWRWYQSFDFNHDLAFIKLDKPFKKAKPIPWAYIPEGDGNLSIKIAGFPGDKGGQKLFMAEGKASYNSKQMNIIRHQLDTWYGNSGSPAVDSTGKVVGVHQGGIKEKGYNLAVAINQDANNLDTIRRFLKTLTPGSKNDKGVSGHVIGRTEHTLSDVTRLRLWEQST